MALLGNVRCESWRPQQPVLPLQILHAGLQEATAAGQFHVLAVELLDQLGEVCGVSVHDDRGRGAAPRGEGLQVYGCDTADSRPEAIQRRIVFSFTPQ